MFIIIAWYNYLIIHVHVNDGQVNLFSIDISYNIIKWKSFLHWSSYCSTHRYKFYVWFTLPYLVKRLVYDSTRQFFLRQYFRNQLHTLSLLKWFHIQNVLDKFCGIIRELVHGGPIFVVFVGSTPPWSNLHPRRKQNIWVGFLT